MLPNRKRRDTSHNLSRVESALRRMAPRLGFRLGTGLAERVAYRELFLLGLTHLDLHRIPQLTRTRAAATGEVRLLLDELDLDCCPAEPSLGEVLAVLKTERNERLSA